MFATLIFRVTLIVQFLKNREIREINVSRKFHVKGIMRRLTRAYGSFPGSD